MKAYKFTDINGQTYNGLQWGDNVTHEEPGNPRGLCNKGWLHFYRDVLVAVMMDPGHGRYLLKPSCRLYEAEAEGEILDDPDGKSGCTRLTTVKQIPIPEVSLNQRIRFGILCAMEVTPEASNPEWYAWARGWLDGTDRSAKAAEAAEAAAAAWAAWWAAEAALRAAEAAATAAAAAAAYEAAEWATAPLDLADLARRAVEDEG